MINKYTDIQDLIDRALFYLATDDRVKFPRVLNKLNTPVKITKIRDDQGFDENITGLTLSVSPYKKTGIGNTSVGSSNVAIKYKDYHPGSALKNIGAFEETTIYLVVKLQSLGYKRDITPSTNNNFTLSYQSNDFERSLRKWSHVIREILLSSPVDKLGGLVKNSKVVNISFDSTDWTGNGIESKSNAVLHSCELLWELNCYTSRNNSEAPSIDPFTSVPNWMYYGMETRTKRPLYIDRRNGVIVTSMGNYLLTTPPPANIPVVYDFTESRLERLVPGSVPNSGAPLTPTELLEPGQTYPWISTNMILVGLINITNKRVYWNTTTNRLEYDDFTAVTSIPYGDPNLTSDDILVSYDHPTRTFTLTYPNGTIITIGPSNNPIITGPGITPVTPGDIIAPTPTPGSPGSPGNPINPGGGYPNYPVPVGPPIVVIPASSSQISLNIWQANFVYLVETATL